MADKSYVVSLLLKLDDAISKPLSKISEVQSRKLQQMGEKWQRVGGTMTKAITAPFLLVSGLAVKTAGDFEKYTQSFSTMLKSQEKGAQFVKDLRDFSARTPLEFKDLASGAETLLAFRIESKNVLPYLKMIGDVARGDAAKMSSLTLAFSQMHSTGRLMGQDLLQMINAGFNPLAIISEKTGKSIGQLKKEMEKGAISTEMVTQAFKDATSEGGMFYQAMQKQSKTFLGRLSTLKDNLSLMLAKIGEMLFPFVNKLMAFVQNFINFFDKLDDSTKELLLTFIALAAAAGPVINVIGRLIKTFSAGFTPMHGFLLAISAIAIAIIALNEAIEKAETFHQDRAKAIREEAKDTKKLEREYDELASKTDKTNEQKQRMANIETILKKRIGETAFELDEQTGALRRNKKASEEYYTRMAELERKQIQYQLARDVAQLEFIQKTVERLKKQSALETVIRNEQFLNLQHLDEKAIETEKRILENKQKLAALSDLDKDSFEETTESVEELGKTIDKLGKKEEKPLLQLPTKLGNVVNKIDKINKKVSDTNKKMIAEREAPEKKVTPVEKPVEKKKQKIPTAEEIIGLDRFDPYKTGKREAEKTPIIKGVIELDSLKQLKLLYEKEESSVKVDINVKSEKDVQTKIDRFEKKGKAKVKVKTGYLMEGVWYSYQ
jgi:tape measure domain-containing protein